MDADQPTTAACAFGDPTCPCQDGDVCHYVDDPKSETLAMTPPATAAWPYPALYFGCWRSVGHGYYAPGMSSANYKTHSSELTPWGDGIDGRFTPQSTSKQGAARLTYNEGWTVLSIHDYTVDSRGGSHSTFAFVGTLDYDEAVAAATEHFPEVMRRLGAIERVDR